MMEAMNAAAQACNTISTPQQNVPVWMCPVCIGMATSGARCSAHFYEETFMKNIKNLPEWMITCGVPLIAVALIDSVGVVHAIMIGAGIALLFGGLARLIKRDKDTRDKK